MREECLKKKSILFITNYPSPYRVDFWNLFGQQVDLTVAFTEKPEAQRHRSVKWFNTDYSGFKAVFLKDEIKIGKLRVFLDIIPLLKAGFDHIIFGGYTSGTQMVAIEYLRLHNIPFILEADGGLIQKDSKLRFLVKRHFIGAASVWMSSGKPTTDYFIHYGADPEKIYLYPFTSQWQRDLDQALQLIQKDKRKLRKQLGMTEDKIVISVGRFSYQNGYGKGYDILCKVAESLEDNVGIYIIGDEPTDEFVEWKESGKWDHVHFVGFKKKNELAEYYAASDIFVLLTRGDVWGLVINEAMAFGLPIITTDMCGAGLSMVEDGVNGFIVPVGDHAAALKKLELLLTDCDLINRMGHENLKKISQYTIEKMTDEHVCLFTGETLAISSSINRQRGKITTNL